MRINVTAQRKQGITEPAKQVELASGTFLTSNFIVPGKPARNGRPGTKDIVVAIAVPTDNRRMANSLTQMSQANVSETLDKCHLLVGGFSEIINDYLLTFETSDLTEQQKRYVDTVTSSFTWGPGGLSGTADIVLLPTSLAVISKQAIERMSDLQSDATIIRTQKDDSGAPKLTKNGSQLKRVGPCYRSLIAPGMSAGTLRAWPTKTTMDMFAELPTEDTVVALEGGIVKKAWKTDDGDERTNLEVQVNLLFPVGLKPEYAYLTMEEQAVSASSDIASQSDEVSALNNSSDFDDDNEIIDDY